MIKVLLIGYGRMGAALATTWQDDSNIHLSIVSPELNRLNSHYPTPEQLPANYRPDVIVLAVKPQIMNDVLPHYTKFCTFDTLVLSIAAGYAIETISNFLSGRLIRIMPNLPITTGLGVYGVFSSSIEHQDRLVVELLLSPSGTIVWLETEDQVDRITAISGSGPAYFYLFTQALSAAAEELGFTNEQSILLAQATFIGSAELLKQSNTTAEILRQQVTSPGGTTAAALESFIDDDIYAFVRKATRAAYDRAKELSK